MADFPDIAAQLEAEQPAAEAPAAPCLSDEDILLFAVGRLQGSRLVDAHQHLDACDTCQRLLSEAAHALATAPTTPLDASEDLSWNTTFRPGTLVGQRYLIAQFIARGGMGEVYEAFDRELQERVALKTVTSTACDNPSAVRRLKGEVQLARRVGHPNVCRIYDFGTHTMPQTGAQISFLTMEFVDGETLGQRVRLAGALPILEAQKLARQLLRGLSAAHEAGVLHRDFKSDNVMLRADGSDDVSPLILDFGLARAFDHDPRSGASSSNPTLVGTFEYIAPEQLEGKAHTTASDVYSLGIVWFEMLTGELPFESNSSPAVAALERLQKDAPAPSSKNPEISHELDAIVLGCLRRSPKDRFRTPGEVLAALDALESRTRTSRHKSRLMPLAIAAGLGGIAAYVALSTGPTKPTLREPVRTLNAAAPAAQGSTVQPIGPAPAEPEPVAAATNAERSAARSEAAHRPVGGAGARASQGPAPGRAPLGGFAKPTETSASPATSSTPPAPALVPNAAHAKSGWENPFRKSPPRPQTGQPPDDPPT